MWTCNSWSHLPSIRPPLDLGGYLRLGSPTSPEHDCQIEGTFEYVSPQIEATEDFSQERNEGRHVFFLATTIIPVMSDNTSTRSPAFLREASTHSRKQSSISSLRGVKSSAKESPLRFPFSFDIPPSQPSQKIPPTFSTAALVHSGTRGRAFVEKTEVAYRVTAFWEPSGRYGDPAS
jgi:hypothetical protein